MSRAEEQALKAYPRENDAWDEGNVDKRIGYRQGYEQAAKDIKDWIDNNLSGYITNDGDWADIEHKFKEEFGS